MSRPLTWTSGELLAPMAALLVVLPLAFVDVVLPLADARRTRRPHPNLRRPAERPGRTEPAMRESPIGSVPDSE